MKVQRIGRLQSFSLFGVDHPLVVDTSLGDVHAGFRLVGAIEAKVAPERASQETHAVQFQGLAVQEIDANLRPEGLLEFGQHS